MRVLVVEDHPGFRRQIADALGEAGYAVDVAGSNMLVSGGHHCPTTKHEVELALSAG